MVEQPSERDHASDELITQVVDHIIALSGQFVDAGDAITAPEGLSAAQWLVLGALQEGAMTPAQIARKRGLRRQSIRETVARLERNGLVARTEGTDRRTFLVELTGKGSKTLTRIEPRRRKWAMETAQRVDFAELERMAAMLAQLREATAKSTARTGDK